MSATEETGLVVEALAPGVRQLRLDRPERLNALGLATVRRLKEAVAEADANGTRVLVVRGTGRAFCVGADLKERQGADPAARLAHNRAINAAIDALAGAALPSIALINGVAVGGGCELALGCDLRFAVPEATIGLTEARVGVIPGAGGTQRLPRLIGVSRALELMLTGEPVTAARAAEIGLVNAVVAAEAIDAHVLRLAALIASRSPRTSRLLKGVVNRGIERPLAEGLALEGEALGTIFASADYEEGLAAFHEKRQPRFR